MAQERSKPRAQRGIFCQNPSSIGAFGARVPSSEGVDLLDWVIVNTPFQNNIPVYLVQKGILLFESGQRAAAKEAFARSWSLAGDFGFRGEDPKYLALCDEASRDC